MIQEKMDKVVSLVLPGVDIGGVEKRLVYFWLYSKLQNKTGLKLLLSFQLFEKLKLQPDLFRLREFESDITFIDFSNSTLRQILLYSKIRRSNKKATFHFIIYYPFFSLNHNNIYTIVTNSLKHYNFIAKVSIFLSILLSKKVDVLDPTLHKKLQKYFFFKKNAITLTSNSFVIINERQLVPFLQRDNIISFLGRFSPEKQVIEFINSIPNINNALSRIGIQNVKFKIYGYGPLGEKVYQLVHTLQNNINIEVNKSNDPQSDLAKSKVLVSLQKFSNYPSRSLLEGLGTGNIVIVTDCGDTRRIALPEFSFYVPEKFSDKNLVDQFILLFSLTSDKQKTISELGKNFVINNFTIKKMADYYYKIYGLQNDIN